MSVERTDARSKPLEETPKQSRWKSKSASLFRECTQSRDRPSKAPLGGRTEPAPAGTMVKVAGHMGALTRAVACAAIVCALVLKSLALAPLPNATAATFSAAAAPIGVLPADDCKRGGAPQRDPLHDGGTCAPCASCGAGPQAERAVLPSEAVASAPQRLAMAWRPGDDEPPASAASRAAWQARAPPASA